MDLGRVVQMATVDRTKTTIHLHEAVELTTDVWGVKSGSRGYVVDAYPEKDSYTVEFLDAEGEHIAAIPLESRYLRPAPNGQ